MALQRLKEFLDARNVRYSVLTHSPAYTAHDLAADLRISEKELAKTVMVKLDGKLAMAVLPACERVDLTALALATGARNATLATESEFGDAFPECDVGAMPPFGNFWSLPVYVSETLAEDEKIAFNAGNHREVVTLAFADFKRLVEPKLVRIAKRAA